MLLPAGCADSEIDRQFCKVTRRRPDELPALAFCLLFRFQGAEARARIKTVQALTGLPAQLTLGLGVGARCAFPVAEALREAKNNVTDSGSEAQPAS